MEIVLFLLAVVVIGVIVLLVVSGGDIQRYLRMRKM